MNACRDNDLSHGDFFQGATSVVVKEHVAIAQLSENSRCRLHRSMQLGTHGVFAEPRILHEFCDRHLFESMHSKQLVIQWTDVEFELAQRFVQHYIIPLLLEHLVRASIRSFELIEVNTDAELAPTFYGAHHVHTCIAYSRE